MMSGERRLPLRWIALGFIFVCAGTLIALLAYLSGDRRVVTETSDSKPPKLTEKPSPAKPPAKKSVPPTQQTRNDPHFLEDLDEKQSAPDLTPMEVWDIVAKDEGLSPQLVEDVHDRLTMLLKEHGISWTQGQVSAFSESLKKFIRLHKKRLLKDSNVSFNVWMRAGTTSLAPGPILPNASAASQRTWTLSQKGTIYWLLYCTAEAFSRSDQVRNDNSVLDDYDLFNDEIVDLLSVRIAKSLPPAGRAVAWSGKIQDALAKSADEIRRGIAALKADFLCPSYHRPLTQRMQQHIVEQQLYHQDYPTRERKKSEAISQRLRQERGDPIRTKEELFQERLVSFSEFNVLWFMDISFSLDTMDMTSRTTYWGDMFYSGRSTNAGRGQWPMAVKLRLADEKKTIAARPKAVTEMVRTWLSGITKTTKAFKRALFPAKGRQGGKVKEQEVRLPAILLQDFSDEMRKRLVTYIGLLDSKDRGTYESAIEGLAQIHPVPVSVLTFLMKREKTRVRLGAVKVLKKIGPPAVSAISALRDALRDRAYSVRRHAAYALGRIGPRSVPFLVKVLRQKESPALRYHVIEALGMVGPAAPETPEVVSILIQVLKQEKIYFLRAIAAEVLGKVSSNTPEVLSALRGALKDDDSWVRGHAATALSNIGRVTEAEVAALIKALEDEVALVRWRAASALGKLDPETPEIIAALLGSLQDSDSDVRATAAQALENTGGRDKKMLQALITLLEDKDYFVRLSSAKALGSFGPAGKDAIPALQVLLHEIDSRVWNASSDALGKIAPGVKFEARRPPGAEDIF